MGEGHRRTRMVDGGYSMSEKWYLDHMGIMAFWRTILGGVNLVVAVAIALKVFEVI